MRLARIALLAAVSSIAFAGQIPTPVTLRRTFRPGTVEKFVQIAQTETDSGPVPIDFKMTSELKRTITKVDDKGADFRTETLKVSMEPDPGSPLPTPTLAGHVDPFSVVDNLKTEGQAAPAGFGDMMSAFTTGKIPDGVSLPEKPVKPGDSWTFKPGFTQTLNAEGEYVYTFKGEKELEGKSYWYVTGVGSFALKGKDGVRPTDVATVMASMKGSMNFTVEAYLDKSDCTPVLVTTKGSTSMTMASMGIEVNTRTTVTQKRT